MCGCYPESVYLHHEDVFTFNKGPNNTKVDEVHKLIRSCVYRHDIHVSPWGQEKDILGLGRIRSFCDYRFMKGNTTSVITVIPGSKFRTDDCMDCTCDRRGLRCCGLGIRDQHRPAPNGCTRVADGCNPILVRSYDHSIDCYSGMDLIEKKRQDTLKTQIFNTLEQAGPAISPEQRQQMMLMSLFSAPEPVRTPRMQRRRNGTTQRTHSRQNDFAFGGNNPFETMLMMSMFGGV